MPASKQFAAALAAVALGFLGLLTACDDQSFFASGPATNIPPVSTARPLLPTPTLAPQLVGTVVVAPPPTPVVLPSATPAGGVRATEPSHENAIVLEATSGDAAPAVVEPVAAPLPTADLPPDATTTELLALGQRWLENGDLAAAAAFQAALDQADELDFEHQTLAQYGLGIALLQDGRREAAGEAFAEVAGSESGGTGRSGSSPTPSHLPNDAGAAAIFQLGQLHLQNGAHEQAIAAFSDYLALRPDMGGYVQPMIAGAHEAMSNTDKAIAALETALTAHAQRLKEIDTRRRLAELYLARGDTAAAVGQYDAIRDLAFTEFTKGEMTFLAGQAELEAGNLEAAYGRFDTGVNLYPRAASSYWGLVALVEAGRPVDEYQRGVVDYYAGAYEPGIEALNRAIGAGPGNYEPDGHLFLAWSYEALGNTEAALAELETYSQFNAAEAQLEKADLLARTGDTPAAIAAYEALVETDPTSTAASAAAWAVAELAESAGDPSTADRFLFAVDNGLAGDRAPEGLARAAELSSVAGDEARAIQLWQRLATQYPDHWYGSKALVQLLRLAEDGRADLDLATLQDQAHELVPGNYYALRALDLVDGRVPFTADHSLSITLDDSAAQVEAEAWLREQLADEGQLPPGTTSLSQLSPKLASDSHRLVGESLWSLGLQEEAKAELETLREAIAGDPLASYQLALYLRDLGLYRSSIIAAATLLEQTGTNLYDAPPFIGRLVYPVYYADLIGPLSEEYGFDPRFQFALVRQESLFESFARSGAAAQGLAQVIPDTGAWIASRLDWPDYENEDLYKPYVGLRFGAYYLNEQLRGFDDQVHVALAAYNGGPGNAARWLPDGATYDQFVDTIDFTETRNYVQRIYEGFNAYRFLYDE